MIDLEDDLYNLEDVFFFKKTKKTYMSLWKILWHVLKMTS